MMSLARLGYVWWRVRRLRRLLASAENGRHVQREVLLRKLRRHADSDFGRQHGFAQIKSVADFRRQVPLTTYEYYQPYIQRLKRGEVTALFAPGTKLLMFALTSGTTATPKFIPITEECFQQYREGWNLWAVRTYLDHRDMLRKKTLGLASNWDQFCTEGGTPCGSISGLATQTTPLIGRPIFVSPWMLIKIKDPVVKQYASLRLAAASRRVGMLMTANASTLVGLARLADARRESLIRDIHDGTFSEPDALPAEVRRSLGRCFRRADPVRARELENIVAETGHLYPRDFWPELSVLAVWLGGSAGAYLPQLKEYYGQTALRDHGLSASEGRMTIPLSDGTSAGLLEFQHHFFEFIPEDEYDNAHPAVLEAHELEVGKNYFIVLTTSGGLYRYDIHDLVRCVGHEGSVPLLEFLNKGSFFSSINGEKLSEFQAASAVREAFGELGLSIDTFTVAPTFGDPPRYVLLIERGHCGHNPAALARAIDRRLGSWNCEYLNRLETGRLAPLRIQEIAAGTWNAFRQRHISKVGGSLEQYKHPCLANDLDFIDRLLTAKPVSVRAPTAA
jgi:hypothetical protein